MLNRRYLLAGGAVIASGLLAGFARKGATAQGEHFEVEHADAEWRQILGPAAFEVMRRQGTERAGTSPLDHFYKPGVYDCAGCGLALFEAKTKFDSGTGWPSFNAPIKDAVRTHSDFDLGMARTEVHCRRCGGHLGHVFDDGPQPTGLRYCMNGVALKFQTA